MFYSFTDSITAQTEKRYAQMWGSVKNALCMSDIDLIQSKLIQEDTTLKNTLQKKVGKLSSFVEGKSMAQLRREVRKRKNYILQSLLLIYHQWITRI